MENKILKLHENGYIFTKKIRDNNVPTIYLSRLEKKGLIYRVSKGIYLLNEYIEDPFFVQSKNHSKMIYTNHTALYLNNLTNRQFTEIEAIFPYGTNTSKLPFKCSVSRNKLTYELGATYIKTPFGNEVKCHDKERCICNLFLYEVFDEEEKAYAILEYKKNYLNIEKLYGYAKQLGCLDKVKNVFEVIMWD